MTDDRIDVAEVARAAQHARLRLSPSEAERFAAQLDEILEHMRRIAEFDVADAEPLTRPVIPINAARDDEPRASLAPEQVLANSAEHRAGLFSVPSVLDRASS